MKHRVKAEKYIRYADDFVLFSKNKNDLLGIISKISEFLQIKLRCSLHDKKLFIRTLFSGVDFLGWVHFPRHRVLRTITKKRMFKNLRNTYSHKTLSSYLGLLKYGNSFKLSASIQNVYNVVQ